ncbi:MAG: T9SS type A sorting domain-containing protein [Bacteroidota bacterium]|nr:T9SS type A sorting domain-containing protein [Bacteroidota bacterium]
MKKLMIFIFLFSMSFAAISQNTCATAPFLDFQDYGTCGTMILHDFDLSNATASGYTIPPCMENTQGANDLWYKFIVPANVTELSFHVFNSDNVPFPPDISVPGMAVYSGFSCADLELLSCLESDSLSEFSNREIRWEQINGLTQGDTLYLQVWDQNDIAHKLFLAVSERMSMQEDTCMGATPLYDGICNILGKADSLPAPEDCGWTVSDNEVFYHFTVDNDDEQPYTISFTNIHLFGHESSLPSDFFVQVAVYAWDGVDCTDIGGSPNSDPPNNSGAYMGCASDSIDFSFSANLPPGQYILVADGYSSLAGNALFYTDAGLGPLTSDLHIDNELAVYPNPSPGKVHIESEKYQHCAIYSAIGKLLQTYEIMNGNLTITGLKTGMYFMRFFNEQDSEIRKLVVY